MMDKSDYNKVREVIAKVEAFVDMIKERQSQYRDLTGELQEDFKRLHQLFPCIDFTHEGALSRELSVAITNFYGENSKLLRFVGGVDQGDHIDVTIVTVRPGILIGYAGTLYDQLNKYLNEYFEKRVHIHIKEEMWHHSLYLLDYEH